MYGHRQKYCWQPYQVCRFCGISNRVPNNYTTIVNKSTIVNISQIIHHIFSITFKVTDHENKKSKYTTDPKCVHCEGDHPAAVPVYLNKQKIIDIQDSQKVTIRGAKFHANNQLDCGIYSFTATAGFLCKARSAIAAAISRYTRTY